MYDMKWKKNITLNKEAIRTIKTKEFDYYTLIIGNENENRSSNILSKHKS
jgi:hypothetical protein